MPLVCRENAVTALVVLLVVSGASCKNPDVLTECEDPGLAPLALNKMPDLEMMIGEVQDTSIVSYFGDPCGRELNYTVQSSAPSAVAVSVSGTDLTVTAVDEEDSAVVRVEAANSLNLSAFHRFHVMVEHPNRAPVAVGSIADQVMSLQRLNEVGSVAGNFFDPDGDSLLFAAVSSDTVVVKAKVARNGSTFTLNSRGKEGVVTVTVIATDPDSLSASIELSVTVRNRPPVFEGSIGPFELSLESSIEDDIDGEFSDPDFDLLTYDAESNDSEIATAEMSGTMLTIKSGETEGTTTVTVTATDTWGASTSTDVSVTVVDN